MPCLAPRSLGPQIESMYNDFEGKTVVDLGCGTVRGNSAALPAAIELVEQAHYLPFARPPRVNVCGTDDCFRRYVMTPRLSAAVVPDNRLILSPNLDGRESHRLQTLLTHELAHLLNPLLGITYQHLKVIFVTFRTTKQGVLIHNDKTKLKH